MITGASSGIGRAAALELAGRGFHVGIVARDEARGEAALEEVRAVGSGDLFLADFAELAQVRALADEVLERWPRLDVLINNAGVILTEHQRTTDGHEMMLQVNHLAPFLLTKLLLPRLQDSAPARVVNVSSAAHKRTARLDVDDLESGGFSAWPVYGRTKLMNVLFTRALARRLEGTGVTTNALHPGVVNTGFAADGDTSGLVRLTWGLLRPFMRGAARGAETIVYLASSPEVEGVSGRYYVDCEEARPSAQARDDALADGLWAKSESVLAEALRASSEPAASA